MKELIPYERIENKIFVIRGLKVMIDRDLADLYGVETKYLNRQVKRNAARFPAPFMFRLSRKEKNELVTICHRFETMKHASSLPYVFTEHGVAMLASVLNSQRAIAISILIIKTFLRLRELVSARKELACKLKELEDRITRHDMEIGNIFEAIRQLLTPPPAEPKRRIGFLAERSPT